MKNWAIKTSETTTVLYVVSAETPEEAQEKLGSCKPTIVDAHIEEILDIQETD